MFCSFLLGVCQKNRASFSQAHTKSWGLRQEFFFFEIWLPGDPVRLQIPIPIRPFFGVFCFWEHAGFTPPNKQIPTFFEKVGILFGKPVSGFYEQIPIPFLVEIYDSMVNTSCWYVLRNAGFGFSTVNTDPFCSRGFT